MPGTPLLHNPQNRKGGSATEPVLKAEARPVEHGTQSRYLHAVCPWVWEGGAGSSGYSLHGCHQSHSPPGLSPWHSIVQVLTYLPAFPFLILPSGTLSLGAFSLGDLL